MFLIEEEEVSGQIFTLAGTFVGAVLGREIVEKIIKSRLMFRRSPNTMTHSGGVYFANRMTEE